MRITLKYATASTTCALFGAKANCLAKHRLRFRTG